MKTTQIKSTSRFKFNSQALRWMVSSLFLFGACPLQAAEVEKEFYLNTEVLRLSNPNFSDTDKNPVTIFKIAPQFNLTVASELNKFYLKSLLSIYRNSNEDVLPNRENPTITAGWERTLASGIFGIEAFYDENVALTEQLSRLGAGTGNIVENQVKTKAISAKWDHEFNAKVAVKNKVTYSDYSYSEATPVLFDYTLMDAVSRVIYQNSDTLKTYAQLGHVQFDSDSNTASKSKISRARLGVLLNPIDGLDVDANAGFYKTSGSDSSDGLEAEVNSVYTRDRLIYNFTATRLITASGVGQFQKTDAFLIGAKYLVSDVRTVGAEYGNTYNRAPTAGVFAGTNVRTQSLGVFYEHTFQDWLVRANAKFIELDNGISRYGNEIGVSLTYGPLRF